MPNPSRLGLDAKSEENKRGIWILWLHNRTVQVTTALLFCLGMLLFFQHVPGLLRWPARMLMLGAIVWVALIAIQAVRTVDFSVKKVAFSFIVVGIFYAALSLICQVFIGLMSPRDDRLSERGTTSLGKERRSAIEAFIDGTSYEMYDREIGWVLRPGFKSIDYQFNSQGIRSLRLYPVPAADPARRILCMGDSFTFGFGVADTETYPFHAESLCPDTEWINLGINGTCLLQSLLHYRKNGRGFGGKYVVIGFMTNDGQRTVNCFRPFVTPGDPGNPYTKPFAKYFDSKFSIEPNPYQSLSEYQKLLNNETQELNRLREIDYTTWSSQIPTGNAVVRTAQYVYESMHLDRNVDRILNRPLRKTQRQKMRSKLTGDPYGKSLWHPRSPAFNALTNLFDLYHSEIIADGRIPLIVIIPGPIDVENYSRGFPRQYDTLLEHLKTKGYRYLDFLDPLVEKHRDDLSMDALFIHTHYQGHINRELAQEIINELGL